MFQKKSCFTPHSVVTQPKMKTSGEEKTPIFPPLRPSNQPLPLNGSHPDTLEVDASLLLVKVVRALEPPPAAHIPESVEALVASLPSMPWGFFEKSVDDLLIHC